MLRQALLAVLLMIGLPASGPAGASGPACPPVSNIAAPGAAAGMLPGVAAGLKAGQLDVLAIGSGTVLGARGRAEGSFADRMAQELRAAAPGAAVRLTVQGERGMTAALMLATLRRDLAGRKYQLVVWQTGTVEAVRKLPPEEFARTLDDGAAAVSAAGAELVLVDPQFSRMLQNHANLAPYREAMQAVAERHHALLFRRFALVRHWAESGELDLEAAPGPDRVKTAALLNTCLGESLARVVLRAAGR
jgi:acyl-CoA thioesterase I